MTQIRAQLRQAARDALIAAPTRAGDNIFLPRDWPTHDQVMPAVAVQTPQWSQDDATRGNGAPAFDTVIWLQCHCQDAGDDPEQLEDNLELLANQVEAAVIGLVVGPQKEWRRIIRGEGEIEIRADGRRHFGTAQLRFGFVTREVFTPVLIDTLDRIVITGDLKRPADPTGTYPAYPDPAFQAQVMPAPRTEGPDGRPEFTIDETLPQD